MDIFPCDATGFDSKCLSFPIKGNTKPSIIPATSQLVVQFNKAFELHCLSDNKTYWRREERPKPMRAKQTNGKLTVLVPRAFPSSMGRYICVDEGTKEQASIYVFVKGRCTCSTKRTRLWELKKAGRVFCHFCLHEGSLAVDIAIH